MIISLSIAISFIYVLLIISLIRHWEEIPYTKIPHGSASNISLSVIIIARDEEANITSCLQSILDNDYPSDQFEIIVVDDHSQDNTIQYIQKLNSKQISILHLSDFVGTEKVNGFKKHGIKYALSKAKFEYIIHTDADCLVPKNWLATTAYNFEKGIKLQAAPISFKPINSFLQWFQQLDMYTLMASTNAGIRSQNWYLANGANLAYQKSSLPANVYSESNKYASGDDVYLINQMADQNADNIHFEPKIVVTTKAVDNMSGFLRQRIRWAGKNRNLAKGKMKNVLFIPVICNLWIFVLLICLFFTFKLALISLCIFVLIKWMIDYVLLQYMQEKLHPKQKNRHFLLASFCYPFYLLGVGIVSLFTKSYVWKSRRVQ